MHEPKEFFKVLVIGLKVVFALFLCPIAVVVDETVYVGRKLTSGIVRLSKQAAMLVDEKA